LDLDLRSNNPIVESQVQIEKGEGSGYSACLLVKVTEKSVYVIQMYHIVLIFHISGDEDSPDPHFLSKCGSGLSLSPEMWKI